MDAFDEKIQTFNGTIYGTEMRESLYDCFGLLYTEIKRYSQKIQEASDRIRKLESGG